MLFCFQLSYVTFAAPDAGFQFAIVKCLVDNQCLLWCFIGAVGA